MIRRLNAYMLYPLAERCLGRRIRQKTARLRAELALPFPERKLRRGLQLSAMLQRAGRDVPYYRDLFAQLGFDPARVIRDPRCLEELPYLTKNILREQGPRMISERYMAEQRVRRKTGGSTGPAVVIEYSQEALDWTAAVTQLTLEWTGKQPEMKELHFSTRLPQTRSQLKARAKELVKCAALNRVNVFTDRFDPQSLERLRRRLSWAKPYLVQGHPSTLYALALHLQERAAKSRQLAQIIVTTGEVLDARRRETIETVFGCPVLDRYGSAEFGIVAHQRSGDRPLHVFDAVVWPETREHESGSRELVFTNLLNEAMPLVRYCTGDLGQLTETTDGYLLDGLIGRVHDLVQIGEWRYPTHYVMDVLNRVGGIVDFQLEQTRPAVLLLRLVAPPHRQAGIIDRLQAIWADAVAVEFTSQDRLKRCGWQGKFRHLVAPTPAAVAPRQAA